MKKDISHYLKYWNKKYKTREFNVSNKSISRPVLQELIDSGFVEFSFGYSNTIIKIQDTWNIKLRLTYKGIYYKRYIYTSKLKSIYNFIITSVAKLIKG